jgi:VanZ family protein
MVDVPIPLMASRRTLIAVNSLYAAALLILGLIPKVPEVVAGVSDHLAHAAAYAVQTVLLFILLLPFRGPGRAGVIAVLGAVLYGGCVEMLQSLQPARAVEVTDLVANAVGACTAGSIAFLLASRCVTGADE